MNDPKDWELDDLNALITAQAEESSTLEFKNGKVLEDLDNPQVANKRRDEISIDVSAFANRSGGVIIYGLEEEKKEPHSAKALTPIDPAKCSKERLEQIITSRIKPSIQNIVIRPITINARGCAYLVIIPGSHTAHQASDKRYYRRANFGNQMMEDDEIRQIMNRPIRTTYRVQLGTQMIGEDELIISGNVQNTSVMMGTDVSAVLLLPHELSSNAIGGTEVIDGNTFVRLLSVFWNQKSQLKPFERQEIYFGKCKIPDEPPSWTVPLIVRVYDQFGQGHEAEFLISLRTDSNGKIISERQ